eukprot:gene10883-22722_t
MLIGCIGGIVIGISQPYRQILFGRMLDALNKDSNSFTDKVYEIVYEFICLAALNIISGVAQVGFWSIAGERQSQRIREKYVQSILRQEISWFDSCSAGQLAPKLANHCGTIQDGLGPKVGEFVQYGAQIIASFVIGFYLSWKLALALLTVLPVIAIAGYLMISATTSYMKQSSEQNAQAGGLATETLSSIRTITALNVQPDVISRYRIFLIEAMNVSWSEMAGTLKSLKYGAANGLLFAISLFATALGYWYGGQLVADDLDRECTNNCITGGVVNAVMYSVIFGCMAFGQLGPPLTAMSAAAVAMQSVNSVINAHPSIDSFSESGETPTKRPAGKIELQDVDFAYPSRPDFMVCEGYSLIVEPGQTVALCGASGAGKSTIINLLLRFYDPLAGNILLDDMNIKDLNVRWLRSQIGYVGQEPVLFSGSIADNISYGIDIDVTGVSCKSTRTVRERVEAAAKLAHAHQFILTFPNGYDTDVGSNGISLSGGQKQRIAIARALVKRPAVLLLDEATSALDTTSERLVQESIDELQQSKLQTTLVIAHRLSTICNSDNIAVVADGRVVELGTHVELLELDKRYAELVRLQISEDDEEHNDVEEDAADCDFSLCSDLDNTELDNDTTIEMESNVVLKLKKMQNVSSDKINVDKVLNSKDKGIVTVDEDRMRKSVWSMIFAQPGWLIVGFSGSAVHGAIFPVWGLLLGLSQSVFYGSASHLRNQITEFALYFVLLGVVIIVASTLQYWGIGKIGERVIMTLRSNMFESILRRDISYLDKTENSVGTLTTQLEEDSRLVAKVTGDSAAKQIQAIFVLVICLGIALSASWKMALVVLAAIPLNIMAYVIQTQALSGQLLCTGDTSGDKGQRQARASGAISSAFTHMRTVSAFSMQTKICEEYADATRSASNGRMKNSGMIGLGFGFSISSIFLIYALFFWYGSTLITSGEISFEELMIASQCLIIGSWGLAVALSDMGDQTAGMEAAGRIFQAIDESEASPIDGLSNKGITPPTRAYGKIELKNVSFRYPSRPDAVVCKSYNLTIEPGEVVALVGPSGSGKSTIMNLLLRFYDPLEGQVLLDGVDIKDLNVRWLRSQIGYVGQEPVLFSGSIADNIAEGRVENSNTKLLSLEEAIRTHNATTSGLPKFFDLSKATPDVETPPVSVDEDIIQAAIASNADEFCTEFTDGYDTHVGEGSVMVSGGQKQRIAIARALVKHPAVLLLDEATSALDSASERMVQQSIDELQKNKMQTTLVIAHRLKTIRNADKIVVIDKGMVVEIGTHEELLANNGLYNQLWNKQKSYSRSSRSSEALLLLNESLGF